MEPTRPPETKPSGLLGRVVQVIMATTAYVAIIGPMRLLAGDSAAVLSVGPVALAAWHFDLPGGLIAGLLALPLNLLVLRSPGGSLAPVNWAPTLLGGLAVLSVGVMVGWASRESRAHHRTATELYEKQRLLESILNTTPGIVYLYDHEAQQSVFTSREVARVLGYTPEEIRAMGTDLFEKLLHPDDFSRFPAQLERLAATPDGQFTEWDYRLRRADGEWRWFFSRDTVFERRPDGSMRSSLGVTLDITDRKTAEERLAYVSYHDALTDLYNRAYLQEEIARLERSRHYPVSVIVADVDELKQVNDRHGHAAGDDLLCRIATALRAAVRAEDVVGRTGGDEFVVLLPKTDAETLPHVLERITRSLQAAPDSARVSIGAATAGVGHSITAALGLADARMYQAKSDRADLTVP